MRSKGFPFIVWGSGGWRFAWRPSEKSCYSAPGQILVLARTVNARGAQSPHLLLMLAVSRGGPESERMGNRNFRMGGRLGRWVRGKKNVGVKCIINLRLIVMGLMDNECHPLGNPGAGSSPDPKTRFQPGALLLLVGNPILWL